MSGNLNKLFALVLWADEKVTDDEIACLEVLNSKYDFSIDSVKSEIENLLNGNDLEDDSESENPLSLDSIDIGEIDELELLTDLASLAVSDKEIDFGEISILHEIGSSIGADAATVTAALLSAMINSKGIKLTIQKGEES
jgi:hypothetical protein